MITKRKYVDNMGVLGFCATLRYDKKRQNIYLEKLQKIQENFREAIALKQKKC